MWGQKEGSDDESPDTWNDSAPLRKEHNCFPLTIDNPDVTKQLDFGHT